MTESSPEQQVPRTRPLPGFTQEPLCPKCSGTGIRIVYHGAVVFSLGEGQSFPCAAWLHQNAIPEDTTEHLCLMCMRCGYGWPSQTADTPPIGGLEWPE